MIEYDEKYWGVGQQGGEGGNWIHVCGRSSLTNEKHHDFLNRFVCVLVSSLIAG